jgi:DNA polymerase-3 subunit gamma/tau
MAKTTTKPQEGYTVLARRYRPQSFEDLVGQEAVARALQNAIKANRVAHAYLFTGIRGVGKTTVARILAKALNCEKGPTPTPCNECSACKSIAAGDDVDVLEIDGASNNKVDEIRELRGNVQYRPSRGRYKIYIIDEVHMLSASAFNALLKTLEEPPPHVKFIFATTEVQALPVTILSRCQRFDLGGISLPQIKTRLKEIVEQEGMQADDEALELIARRANGSMRDAQSVLDQLLAFGGERLTADQVHNLLGTAGDEHILALAEAVLSGDPRRALEQLEEAVARGFQLAELTDQLIDFWRDLLLVNCVGTEARGLSVQERNRAALTKLAKPLNVDTILAGLEVLSATRARLRNTTHGRTLIEMALVRLGRMGDLMALPQIAQFVAQLRVEGIATPSGVRISPPEGVKKKPLNLAAEPAARNPVDSETSGKTSEITAETLPVLWPQLLGQIGTLLASDLSKAGTPAIFGPNALAIRFPAAYNREREFCQEPVRLGKVEAALLKMTGQKWTLRVETLAAPAPAAPLAPVAEVPRLEPPPPRRGERDGAEKEPLIKRALEVLGAQILRVPDGFGAASAVRTEGNADNEDVDDQES